MEGGWLASVAKGPSRTDAFLNPFVCPLEKGLQPDIRAARRFSLGRVRSCVFRRVHGVDDDEEVGEGKGGGDIRTRIQEWNV